MKPTIHQLVAARNAWIDAQNNLRHDTKTPMQQLREEEYRLYQIYYNLHIDYYTPRNNQ